MMRKTQVQLPNALYERAREFAEDREMSLAELTRRSLELYLNRFPAGSHSGNAWKLPVIDPGGPIRVSSQQLREILDNEYAKPGFR